MWYMGAHTWLVWVSIIFPVSRQSNGSSRHFHYVYPYMLFFWLTPVWAFHLALASALDSIAFPQNITFQHSTHFLLFLLFCDIDFSGDLGTHLLGVLCPLPLVSKALDILASKKQTCPHPDVRNRGWVWQNVSVTGNKESVCIKWKHLEKPQRSLGMDLVIGHDCFICSQLRPPLVSFQIKETFNFFLLFLLLFVLFLFLCYF